MKCVRDKRHKCSEFDYALSYACLTPEDKLSCCKCHYGEVSVCVDTIKGDKE